MKSFLYLCADPGIPVPGTKGASIHVASLCRAFQELALTGEVLAQRVRDETLEGLPLHALKRSGPANESRDEREVRLFLSQGVEEATLPAFEFVYERYSLWHTGGLSLARRHGVPLVLEVNSPLPLEARRHRSLRYETLAQGIADLLMSEADLVVAVSEEVAAWVRELRGHGDGVVVIPNGVDAERFRPRRERHPQLPAAPTPVLAFAGSFRPWHDVAVLIHAFGELCRRRDPAPHLVLVGDGPTAAETRDLCQELGVAERVTFSGAVPHEAVAEWLGGADVAICPYPETADFYFSPLKLYEFLALELPVVASEIGQVRDVISDRGILVPPGSASALADGIERALDDPNAARRTAAAGREWILEHATWKTRARQILDALKAVR